MVSYICVIDLRYLYYLYEGNCINISAFHPFVSVHFFLQDVNLYVHPVLQERKQLRTGRRSLFPH